MHTVSPMAQRSLQPTQPRSLRRFPRAVFARIFHSDSNSTRRFVTRFRVSRDAAVTGGISVQSGSRRTDAPTDSTSTAPDEQLFLAAKTCRAGMSEWNEQRGDGKDDGNRKLAEFTLAFQMPSNGYSIFASRYHSYASCLETSRACRRDNVCAKHNSPEIKEARGELVPIRKRQ
ncbi:hypothetical protein BU26DRAFT_504075 [Trematosphaeria pertusa]|uniref:Uncharacterized protein n=1 Tax=Trematosphaeria pertusa TaxID=390896 RepID=A0A6A6IG93_9PLEO|nr:uncharacterized protein BU26DRAFT_504075 [Trematosphaeria pertusa]KAF2249605.1 hypothetical protein BU26DRAFT_504075 [Trematosphaeria pertusa]